VADTGLDQQHCMLYDDLPLLHDTLNPLKRKLIYYSVPSSCAPSHGSAPAGEGGGSAACGDSGDEARGHGTFVTGSVVGNALSCSANSSLCFGTQDFAFAADYNGLAQNAKVAFTDIQVGDQPLTPPDDLRAGLLDPPYALAEARVFLISWGCVPGDDATSCNVYSSNAAEIDEFVHENRDALVIIAAGNEGLRAPFQTVGAPATAKNALAVGYLERSAAASYEAFQFVDPNELAGCDGGGGGRVASCCTQAGGCTITSCCAAGVQSCCATEYSSPTASADNVAGGSSRGWTKDLRIKPDLVAPGTHIVSARARGPGVGGAGAHCGRPGSPHPALITKSGSSMAAAQMAAAALVVRQYFADGWYPSGKPEATNGFQPSAALLRGALIASAVAPRGAYAFQDRNVALGNTPNEAAGYGAAQLSRLLRVASPPDAPASALSPAPPFSLWVKDEEDKHALHTGDVHQYVISNVFQPLEEQGAGSGSMRDVTIVLVWSDVAGVPSASSALVNDLDLNVTIVEDGMITRSRGQFRTNDANGGTHPQPRRDSSNNVEKVVVTGAWADGHQMTPSHALSIQVSGFQVVGSQGQTYALVVTGPDGLQIRESGASLLDNAARALRADILSLCVIALALVLGSCARSS